VPFETKSHKLLATLYELEEVLTRAQEQDSEHLTQTRRERFIVDIGKAAAIFDSSRST